MMKQNVLVTGTPRSGTTFLGKILSFPLTVNYIWEPFNKNYRLGIPDYYPYLSDNSSQDKFKVYDKIINDTINLKNLTPVVIINKGDGIIKRKVKKIGINKTTYLWYKKPIIKKYLLNPKTTVYKDPIGIYLSQYLIEKYDFKIIGVIRHPAAVISSRENLKWRFNFNWWKQQKELYDDLYSKFDKQRDNYPNCFVSEAAFHWLTCYSYLHNIYTRYPNNCIIVRHEDICENPVLETGKMYKWLNIKISKRCISKIRKITSGRNIERTSENLAKLENRNAKELVYKWKSRINEDQLNLIMKITNKISNIYYKEPSLWSL